jgi:aconitate hydratase
LPIGRRSRTWRRSTALPAASFLSTTRRCAAWRLTARDPERIALVEAYCKENLLWRDPDRQPEYTQIVELDLGTVVPSIAGPRRPRDRLPLSEASRSFTAALDSFGIDYADGTSEKAVADTFPASDPTIEQSPGGESLPEETSARSATATGRHPVQVEDEAHALGHGSVVIAAITSCTNTSNPQVMIGAGLLAKKAVERGLARKSWVKSSLAPGSRVVTQYLERAGRDRYLDALGFQLVGYGCTTCIGSSGPLPEAVSQAIRERDLVVCAVLSGNRNFEARIHAEVKANYLASPPLVVAYALAGRMDIDFASEPLGEGAGGEEMYLRELWPSAHEIQETIIDSVRAEMFEHTYAEIFGGDERWRALPVPEGRMFAWDPDSTYVRLPPYFGKPAPQAVRARGCRVGPLPRRTRRLGHNRPYLASGRDQAGLAGRPLYRRARHRAARVQHLRFTARQSRGHGAWHVRERAAAQPARARRRARQGRWRRGSASRR